MKNGERLYLKWSLPFMTPPGNKVVLPTAGDDVTFYDSSDNLLTTFNRNIDGSEYWLSYEDGKWVITLDTNDTFFLPIGDSRYEFTLLDENGDLLIVSEGKVTVDA